MWAGKIGPIIKTGFNIYRKLGPNKQSTLIVCCVEALGLQHRIEGT